MEQGKQNRQSWKCIISPRYFGPLPALKRYCGGILLMQDSASSWIIQPSRAPVLLYERDAPLSHKSKPLSFTSEGPTVTPRRKYKFSPRRRCILTMKTNLFWKVSGLEGQLIHNATKAPFTFMAGEINALKDLRAKKAETHAVVPVVPRCVHS